MMNSYLNYYWMMLFLRNIYIRKKVIYFRRRVYDVKILYMLTYLIMQCSKIIEILNEKYCMTITAALILVNSIKTV